MPVRTFDLATIGHIIRVVLLHVHLPIDEKIDVVAGQALIEQARQSLARSCRLNQVRCDNDDEIGIAF